MTTQNTLCCGGIALVGFGGVWWCLSRYIFSCRVSFCMYSCRSLTIQCIQKRFVFKCTCVPYVYKQASSKRLNMNLNGVNVKCERDSGTELLLMYA